MTKRAQYIDKFVNDLTWLAVCGMHYKCVAFGKANTPEELKEQSESRAKFDSIVTTLKATLCNVVENNEEQAEALMHELQLKWTHKTEETE